MSKMRCTNCGPEVPIKLLTNPNIGYHFCRCAKCNMMIASEILNLVDRHWNSSRIEAIGFEKFIGEAIVE